MGFVQNMARIKLIILLGVVFSTASAGAFAASLPDFTKLVEEVSPAVVKINTMTEFDSENLPEQGELPDILRHFFRPRDPEQRRMRAMGSGFLISSDGYILTNHHVIDNVSRIQVRLTDMREYRAMVIGSDPRSDLALLKIDEERLPYLKFANSDKVKVGEWVLAIGSPFGLDFSVSAGIISAKGRSIPTERNENYVPFIQTDVAINPGNSGGPLFNLDGQVVGVVSQIYTQTGGSIGLSFAIPSDVTENVVAQLKEKGSVDRGWLGVVIQSVDKKLADSFGLKVAKGALVTQMKPGGPAAAGGIKVGDIILEFDGNEIMTSADLPHVVGVTPPGEKVPVVVMRKGKRRTVSVEVGTLAAEDRPSIAMPSPTDEAEPVNSLGIGVANIQQSTADMWQLEGGVVVQSIAPDSPAAETGLKVGDIITQIGFEEITDVATFNQILADLPKEKLLPIRYFRNGRPTFETITLKDSTP